jgi:hypothetical protein
VVVLSVVEFVALLSRQKAAWKCVPNLSPRPIVLVERHVLAFVDSVCCFGGCSYMMEKMNQEKFVVEIKQLIVQADWHRRYATAQSRKYHRIDYWAKMLVGMVSLVGAALLGNANWKWLGGIMAGVGAFILGNIVPLVKWEAIVSGLKQEQEDWTKIFHSAESLLRISEISDKGEILLQELQRIVQMRETCALNERNLPVSKKLLDKYEVETRGFYKTLGFLQE